MILAADEVEGTHLEADICVIGTGPAGAIAAVELARAGLSVVMLEAGLDEPGSQQAEGLGTLDVFGEADLQVGPTTRLGGASNLWAGRVAPLEPVDFVARDWVPGSGWPIGAVDLVPFYEKGRVLVMAPGAEAAAVPPPSHAGLAALLRGGTAEGKFFGWAPEPFRVAPWLKEQAKGLPLRVIAGAPAMRLCEETDGAICAVRAARPSGGEIEVRARQFILAAGGIETPRILLNSRDRSAAGIGNAYDVVGRYFSTHPKADIAALVLDSPTTIDHPLFADRKVPGGRIRVGLGLSAEAQEKHRLLNHYVQLAPLMEYRASRAFETLRGSPVMRSPLIDSSEVVRGLLPGLGLLIFEGLGRLGRLQPRARRFVLRGFLDQYPDRDNRVMLDEARDARGNPKAKIVWRFGERDRQSVLRFFDVLDEELKARGIGHIARSRLAELDDWPLVAIHSHFMGGTRMGTDPRVSVVGPDCRVHGVPNLYVAGPSVFPAYGYANPFLTLAALSYRLADCLVARMR